jgi:Tol biopolymer transport system component
VIHRDLKPANIKIDPEDKVKILDFGLAEALTDPAASIAGSPGDLSNSPTRTVGATVAGAILGTAAYMAPEQARGKRVDKRADIWAFGVVGWEMLTGERLFHGEDTVQVLSNVLQQPVDLERVPPKFRKLLGRCLDRIPKDRLRDIGDARFLLEGSQGGVMNPMPASPPHKGSMLPWAIAGVLGIAVLGLGYIAYRHTKEEAPRVERLSVLVPENSTRRNPDSIPQISPDGRRIVMSVSIAGQASASLWLRDLDSLAGRVLPGTSGASYPFWSPDSRWVGFFADSKLKKMDVNGGPALTLCDAPQARGASWSRDDVIVYGRLSAGLFRVPAAGGTPATCTQPDAGEFGHRMPWFLPDGRHFLYSARNGDPQSQQTRIYVDSIDAKPGVKTRKEIAGADSNAVYASGYVLFVRERTLMAQPFDTSKIETTSDAVPIAEQLDYFVASSQSQFSASRSGTLVYTSGAAGGNKKQLTWFDRSGKSAGMVGTPADTVWALISPDGSTVAIDRREETGGQDIWLHDLARGTDTRFTFGSGSNSFPVWSGDGSRIAFTAVQGNGDNRYVKVSNGVGAAEALDKDPRRMRIDDWSRDGRYIILESADPTTYLNVFSPTSPTRRWGYRSCLGLIRLAGHYSSARMEAAAERALATGACRYQSVKSILKNCLDAVPPTTPPPSSPPPPHDHIRGAEYFD